MTIGVYLDNQEQRYNTVSVPRFETPKNVAE